MNSRKQIKQVGETVGELKNLKKCPFEYYLLYIAIINYYAVARGGIEPPTHGFSVRFKLFSLTTAGLYQLL